MPSHQAVYLLQLFLSCPQLDFRVDILINSLFFSSIFWLHLEAQRILVPRPGIESVPPAVEAWFLNHWTAREVPHFLIQDDHPFSVSLFVTVLKF